MNPGPSGPAVQAGAVLNSPAGASERIRREGKVNARGLPVPAVPFNLFRADLPTAGRSLLLRPQMPSPVARAERHQGERLWQRGPLFACRERPSYLCVTLLALRPELTFAASAARWCS